ncbi:MAG: metalloregulator ArsR/SmtB family transcription factor [Elusimicrobia bacterium]|nr:metalloregulator ArsR/SmtB family transcription factor [Elusimicrobiota bacterium]
MNNLLFKAFADPTRLRILGLLSGREVCVCDLMAVLGEPQPKVSQHLAFLRSAGLVAFRQEGKWRHYALAKPAGRVHARLVACLAECFAEIAELKRDRAKFLKIMRAKEKCS